MAMFMFACDDTIQRTYEEAPAPSDAPASERIGDTPAERPPISVLIEEDSVRQGTTIAWMHLGTVSYEMNASRKFFDLERLVFGLIESQRY